MVHRRTWSRNSIDIAGNQPQLLVRDHARTLDVGLADTGTGFAQALPIVVQHFAYRAGRLKSPILIVEQPELHLHPAAHGNMADLVVETSRTDGTATCIVETHSEQFIMRVRRKIAEGLPEGQAVLWSLNHTESRDDEEVIEPLRVIRFRQFRRSRYVARRCLRRDSKICHKCAKPPGDAIFEDNHCAIRPF